MIIPSFWIYVWEVKIFGSMLKFYELNILDVYIWGIYLAFSIVYPVYKFVYKQCDLRGAFIVNHKSQLNTEIHM